MAKRSFRLTDRQKKLLARELEKRGRETSYERIPRRPDPDRRPLSLGQRRLWFLEQLEPGRAAYSLPALVRLEGRLDVPAFFGAFRETTRRHEVLRSVFPAVAGEPHQRLLAIDELPDAIVDLTRLEPRRGRSAARSLAAREARRSFDLGRGPLVRFMLLRFAPESHELFLNFHHVVSDGQSTGILVRELRQLYEAALDGRRSPLPEPPIQYADFADWQRHRLRAERLAELMGYWRRQLAGMSAVLELPTDRPRPPVPIRPARWLEVELPEELGRALRACCRQRGSTLFTVLLAGFALLLERYTDRRDLVIGSPAAGRTRREVQDLVGFFVNTLVVRLDLSGDPAFDEVLARVRATVSEAFAHQEMPFESLVEELQPERRVGANPLYQVTFTLEEKAEPSFRGLDVELVKLSSGTAQGDLHLIVRRDEDRLRLVAQYDAELFDATTVRRMTDHWRHLLTAAVAEPGRRIGELEPIGPAERHQTCVDWNDAAAPLPRDRDLIDLLEVVITRRPDAVAAVSGDRVWSYRELGRRGRELAAALRASGTRPGSAVGVDIGRSLELVEALVGILAAGCWYVPLDASYPAERLTWMIEDAGVGTLVTLPGRSTPGAADGPRPSAADVRAGIELRRLGGPPRTAGAEVDEIAPAARRPGAVACALYTSGSTGRPKGITIYHRAIARLALGANYLDLRPGQRFAHASNPAFDATTLEVWVTLLSGGCLVVLPAETVLKPECLADELRRLAVEHLFLTTALVHEVARREPTAFSGLRTLLFGGEAADPRSLRPLFGAGPPRRVVNLYGPTEGTTLATWQPVVAPAAGARTVPIGRPVTNTRVYVADRRLRPTPIGVVGELVIGGEGLAGGYLGRPGLTAERFVPEPYSGGVGERLYHTGDLARWRATGELEFVGRADFQVKLRGFRIEPGEIEAVIAEHPAITEAVVVVRDEPPGDRRLVAYAVPAAGSVWDAEALARYARSRLPDYMVPAHWIRLEALPLTANGKIDRRALPSPPRTVAAARGAAPRTPTEELLAEIWAQVLGVETVGAFDDFFELGGHSLLATRVVSRISGVLGVEVPLAKLFSASTVAALAEDIDAARRRGEGRGEAPPVTAAPDAAREAGWPLSFAQERLWFLDQLEPASSAYNVPLMVRLSGRLDRGALAAAVAGLTARHETLRTRIENAGGKPRQKVAAALVPRLPEIDLAGLTPAAAERQLRRWGEAEAARPFDLRICPLVRWRLWRLGDAEHAMLVVSHHIVSDGWSLGILLSELAELYGAAVEDRPPRLRELPVQYRDFACWQHDWLHGEALESEIAHWHERLAGAPAFLELPTDRPRPAVQSYRGGGERFALAPELVATLRSFCRGAGTTLYMALLAGFQALLGRWSGQDDLMVGSPIANRTRLEIEGLIGFFVNTLVVRGELGGGPSVGEWVARVRAAALAAYAHQEVPFEKLVEELQPRRDPSRPPLVQVLFGLQNLPLDRPELADLELAPIELAGRTAKFELSVLVWEVGETISGVAEYNADLFDPTTVRRLVGQWSRWLASALARPERRLGEIELLATAERHQLLVEWNDTAAPGEPRWLHELVFAQARERPETVALVAGGRHVTYRELRRRSGELARRLRAEGVGPETRVGVLLERSPELVTALIAVLEAGGAYVPLDPDFPEERLRYQADDAEVAWVITCERWAGLLGAVRTVWGDRPRAPAALVPEELSPPPLGAESLIYVIYTSGSTGRPKGVMNRHGGVANRLRWMREHFVLGVDDRVLQKTPFSFDVSVWEIFWPLSTGACLVLAQPGGHRDPAYLTATVVAERITALHFVPSMLGSFLEHPAAATCGGLRQVFASGEALTPELVRRCKERLAAPLHNLYGPTEASIEVSWWPARDEPGTLAVVPIGRPITNLRLDVLDRCGRPVPIGVSGELAIGGAALARGYHGRPGLTAERFVPDAHGGVGARRYRTGDAVRRRPDGQIEFLGRLDSQVKLRGVRIELGEVEAVLGEHPEVQAVAAAVREEAPGQPLLVAYVVPAPQASPEAEDLRRFASRRLPMAMVPSLVVMLDELPATASGKVDRKALPPPGVGERTASFVAPRTVHEEILAGIWTDVLGRGPVGLHDNFFDLGGHSLLATQVVARVRQSLGVDLSLKEIFAAPELSRLAASIEEIRQARPASPVEPMARDEKLVLSFAQERLWFLEQMAPGAAAYNICAAAQLSGELAVGRVASCLNEIVRRHEILRTTFLPTDGEPELVIARSGGLSLPLVDLRRLEPRRREPEVRRLTSREARRPFDLLRGPLLRVLLLRLAVAEHVVALNAHHIISDGWSTGILVRELGTLSAGGHLPPLVVQYADFAAWQRRQLASGDEGGLRARELAWWRDRMQGFSGVLELPADRPRPAQQSSRGAQVPLRLSPRLSGDLQRLAQGRGATLFMVLLAGFSALLHRHTGQRDIVVGTPVAGRTRREVEDLIGCFVNTLPLPVAVVPDATFDEHLERVRESTLGAYDHQNLPFEKLVEELQPERDLSRSPLFQVMLALQNTPLVLELPGLTVRALEVDPGTAQFDLSLNLRPAQRAGGAAGGLAGNINYCRDLFDATTIARMAGHLEILLTGGAASPESRVTELTLLSPPERQQLVAEWSGCGVRADGRKLVPVHQLFEEQVRRTPERVALVSGAHVLSFGELDARANRLAHALRRRGVGTETRVSLCLGRSPAMVIGMLGVLKAGGVYVPMDPADPADRLRYLLDDSGVVLALTQRQATLTDVGFQGEVVLVDAELAGLAAEGETNPHPSVHPASSVYVIYTSGSTGRPKGVVVSHRSLASYALQAVEKYAVGPGDRILHFNKPTFDASAEEIYPTLLNGATLLLPRSELLDTREFLDACTAWGITVLSLPTAYWHTLMATQKDEGGAWPDSLRLMILGGEEARSDALRVWRQQVGMPLINTYGPTESTIVATSWAVPEGSDPASGSGLPIGRPLSDARVFLLDARQCPVPAGVVGELCLGGDGVARGYLRRPRLTAERFVPHPFTAEPGARLYKTGDLSRFLAEGTLEFSGRADRQVKVRGFRIELGEIEAAVAALPSVREVAVTVAQSPAGDQQLVGYLVRRAPDATEERPDTDRAAGSGSDDLLALLRDKLPSYMVPSRFVFQDALPRLASGKVDRKALPSPEWDREAAELVFPHTLVEELVAGIWSQVLGVERVGVHDNFFKLGGHSLIAVQVTSRLRRAFGVELPLRELFTSPTVAGLAEKIAAARQGGWVRGWPPLETVPRNHDLPLSLAQERLWVLDRLSPGTATYNMPAALRLHGRLRPAALMASLDEVVRRHESLRTTFDERAGQAVQVIGPFSSGKWPVVDLRGLAEPAQEKELERLRAEEAATPFDLTAGPLLRVCLVHLAAAEWTLLLNVHHIVSDGWSMQVLTRELASFYRAFVEGRRAGLPELPIQSVDYAVWQRAWLESGEPEREITWWREKLDDAPPNLDLPTDRPRQTVRSYDGGRWTSRLPPEVTDELRRLGRRHSATPFMTLLAVFRILLARISGTWDVLVGVPVAGREREELEGLIGFFLNTLVLRVDLSDDPELGQLLERERDADLEAFNHQAVPFEKLLEVLRPERDLDRTPFFQVFFNMVDFPPTRIALPGLTLEAFTPVDVPSKFDLTIYASDQETGITLDWVYNSHLFHASTIRRLAGHFATLVGGIRRQHERRISDLPLLGMAEQAQLLREWNDTARHAAMRCLQDGFERQAECFPDRVAVVRADGAWTYGDIEARANRLAHALRRRSLGVEEPVAILMDRSADMVVAVVGVLKAGGAWAALHPEHPPPRHRDLLEDLGARWLLTRASSRAAAARLSGVEALVLDETLLAGEPTTRPAAKAGPENLAYLSYTSGSTGRPKGVAVCHRSAVTFLEACAPLWGLGADDVVLQRAPLSFDASVRDLLGPLTVGARVVLLADEAAAKDPETIVAQCVTRRVSCVLSVVPTLLRDLVSAARGAASATDDVNALRSLRLLVSSGEVLRCGDVRGVAEVFDPELQLINHYGPTECTMTSTFQRASDLATPREVVALGRPLAGESVHVLERRAGPAAIGGRGEIWIGGGGLARGYLRRPAATAAVFQPDPFAVEPGGRLYRTGDLGRWNARGELEFLGRGDHQVKLRGYRVEPGEIEAVLAAHPAVLIAAVVLMPGTPGGAVAEGGSQAVDGAAQLAAWVKLRSGESLARATLRAYLARRLPDYMVPAATWIVDAMPVLPSGKVDRGALARRRWPQVDSTEHQAGQPRGPVEEMVAAIWCDVLGRARVDVHDDFFELGGHSLLATRVVAHLRRLCGVEMPLRGLFEHPTLASLARAVERAMAAAVDRPLPPIERTADFSSGEGIPLSFAQQRLWFLFRLDPGSAAYNIPIALRLRGRLEVAALASSIDEIVRRHAVLRTRFVEHREGPVQQVDPAWPRPLSQVDLSRLPPAQREREAERQASIAVEQPFDIEHRGVLRTRLLRLRAEDHILVVVLHHIASDAWSSGVMVRELTALYRDRALGETAVLPELAVQYADFAIWQRRWLSEALEGQIAYWRERLAGAPLLLELPLDRPRRRRRRRGGLNLRRWSGRFVEPVERLGRERGATLFMTLLAAFQAVLARYSGQDDVLVGTPVANRTRSEIEPLIGFFVNTLVLRADVSGDPSFETLLGRVRQSCLEAYAHQDLPFERLVEELAPQRDLEHTPLFQVLIVLHNVPRSVFALPGLTIEPQEVGFAESKYDLNLGVLEDGDGLRLVLSYNRDLFDPTTCERLMRHFEALLAAAREFPGRCLSAHSLLGPAQRQQLLREWNDAGRSDGGLLLQTFFERQVDRDARRWALIHGAERRTFGELEGDANRLAHFLRRHGVGPEIPVAILAERSVEMVVAVLGVLKAGGVCVALNPEHPPARLEALLAQMRPRWLLAQAAQAERLAGRQAALFLLDREPARLAAEPSCRPLVALDPDHLAYVVHTSGTTGLPRGVAASHRNAVSYLAAGRELWNIGAGDVVLQRAPLSFDASVRDLLGALGFGARVVLLSDEVAAKDPREILRALAEHQATCLLSVVPTLLRGIMAAARDAAAGGTDRRSPFALRLLISSGEVLSWDDVQNVRAIFGNGVKVINQYGPTECTVTSAYRVVGEEPADGRATSSVDLGRPMRGEHLHVLDRRLDPVPVGVGGEILIGGVGLARGYHRRPASTAVAFVPDPLGPQGGARLYRTGDRGRRRADGRLELLGRLDHQIKLRGVRIEPAEIEASLRQHPQVDEAVVVLQEGPSGGPRLVAFVLLRAAAAEDGLPGGDALRAHLLSRLPDSLVPSAFAVVESLPRLPSGKVDRKRLPILRSQLPDAAATPPRTPLEELLAGLWSEILGVESPGMDQSFFSLGGHSLLATRVVSQIRRHLAVEVPLRALFEAPTIAQLAARIEAELQVGTRLERPLMRRVEPRSGASLSFAQERLWFIDRLEPNSAQYNIARAWRVEGRLRGAALEAALTQVVRRHESLRTTFREADGKPVQVIHPPRAWRIPRVDLRALPPASVPAELRRRLEEEAHRPFDLQRGPLLRMGLMELDAATRVLTLTMHHVVSDAWSIAIFLRELASLYRAFETGAEARLPELEHQYADYAVWQREWLRGSVLEAEIGYWRECLAGAPAALELPFDRPRRGSGRRRGARYLFALPQDLVSALGRLSRRQGATLFMTLLAAFKALLARYAGRSDLVVGAPIAGRTLAETEPLIGFFVNTLVLRTEVSGAVSFRQLLGRVRETTLGAFARQNLPFEKLVEELQPKRDLRHTPFFQVVLVLQNVPSGVIEVAGLTLTPEAMERKTAKFDLTLSLAEEQGALAGFLEFRTDLFDTLTIERLLRHFETMLRAVAEDPQRRVSTIPLLTASERSQLLAAWNVAAAAAATHRGTCLHQTFEARAARLPDAVAVVCEEARLTYAELDTRASALARRLRRLGVGPEVLVGLFAERSLGLIVGLLGILKAGGAYVPLDPSYPRERLAFILDDAAAPVVVTQRSLAALLAGQGARQVLLDDLSPDGGGDLTRDLDDLSPDGGGDLTRDHVTPDNAAYVIYTSGSTGRPKGCVVSHANARRLFKVTEAVYGFAESDAWTLFHSPAFDFSVWEIWGALLYGGRLVVVPYRVSRSPQAFYELLSRQAVTVLNQTPSAFQQLSREVETAATSGRHLPLALRLVIFGGEALELDSLRPWWRRFGDHRPRLVNMYGITETTVHVTCRPLTSADLVTARGSVIGKPIADLRLLVVDRDLEPVPAGVVGEVYVGGAGLARGYLGRPGLTAQRFVPDAGGREPGQRFYRTGDLARHRRDGEFEYLGRADRQVKIRGFRIELGEIEAALVAQPEVAEAVVLGVEIKPGDERLVAYLTATPAGKPVVAAIVHELRQRLPDYMVPSFVLLLEALPLTAHGKIDREALRRLDLQAADSALDVPDFDVPASPIEEMLMSIWSELLGVERVGRRASFFDLGGHSLLAVQLVSRLRRTFDIELPLEEIFRAADLAELARLVEHALRAGTSMKPGIAPAMARSPRRHREFPLSFGQQRFWFLYQLNPASPAFKIFNHVRITGALRQPLLEAAISQVLRRHEVLRTRFVERDGETLQTVDEPEAFRLPRVDLRDLPRPERQQQVQRLARDEVHRPFDLSVQPAVRTTLVLLDEAESVLLLTLHHIVADGWSMGILYREVLTLYEAAAAGQATRLPALPIQYGDYAVWQRQWLRGEALEEQLGWWRRRLAGDLPRLRLPMRGRLAVPRFHGASHPVELSPALSRALRLLAHEENATPFMALLAIFNLVLFHETGQDDIVVGTTVAHRDRPEIENLVGLFVNHLPLRNRLDGSLSFRHLLGRVRDATLGAFAHQDVPYEMIIEDLQPQRHGGEAALFQVLFVMQNFPSVARRAPTLTLQPLRPERQRANFDMTLFINDREGVYVGDLIYDTDLFEDDLPSRMTQSLQALTESVVAAPDRGLTEIAVAKTAEVQPLIDSFNEDL